jgi:peptidoglycan/LPS O-acetylase OafA/YrhL
MLKSTRRTRASGAWLCLVWPFCVRRLTRLRLTLVCLALIAAGPLLRGVLVTGWPVAAYTFTACRAGALATGALLALMYRSPLQWRIVSKWAPRVGVSAALVLVGMIVIQGGASYEHRLMQTAGYSVIAAASGSLLVCALSAPRYSLLNRWLSSRFLRFFGTYSYCLYLVHHPIATWLPWDRMLAGVHQGVLRVLVMAAAATLLSVAVALLSWHLFENPILKLKSRFEQTS